MVTVYYSHTKSTSIGKYNIAHNVPNIEYVFIDKSASYQPSTSDSGSSLDIAYSNSSGNFYYFRRVSANKTNIGVEIRNNDSNESNTQLNVFLCYTKTTD